MVASVAPWTPSSGLSSGVAPLATFPNCHLLRPPATPSTQQPTWVAPKRESPSDELRKAVEEEDWERNYEEGLTRINMRAEWCASEDRCSTLRWLATSNKSQRVLEVGSFCGAGSLAMAEVLPTDGEVVSIELDPFVVEFGQRFRLKSLAGGKIKMHVGKAYAELKKLANKVEEGAKPFDLVIIDADKEGMEAYFDLLMSQPKLLSENAVICVDMTPYKGQPPTRYVKFGFPHRWQSDDGVQFINKLRDTVKARSDLQSFEFGGLLVVTRKSSQQDQNRV
mmetsp:Transcript_91370/g.191019  ORF Transcript_91370/g.191019 Transcript_91370/m.191019 type:complete len:280 (-) Transcript_91370:283-1122(-)|eukprot:CAMPEP_0206456986 /NCGR_PEP_ID=MMETSP0324_2-20121206/22690_1 /ASSEMBLY_ACC=CAM_ASM_000836 /TAXON_ID=2866 /ORGANISM="Crypthecodinium cohnii, Strain Seligo" /LENGTH=279 /DNA_ID=CAMNT_0053928017 /DNA_START=128 /DNA_END=967 /DNA_ORIENTATION=-